MLVLNNYNKLTLIRGHWADLWHLLLAGGVAGKATHLTHHPLAGESHHQGSTVRAFDGVVVGTHAELMGSLFHHVR